MRGCEGHACSKSKISKYHGTSSNTYQRTGKAARWEFTPGFHSRREAIICRAQPLGQFAFPPRPKAAQSHERSWRLGICGR